MPYEHDALKGTATLVVPGLLSSVLSKDGHIIYPPLDVSLAGTPHRSPVKFSDGKAAPVLLFPWSGLAAMAVMGASNAHDNLMKMARSSDGSQEPDGSEVKAIGVVGCMHVGPFEVQTIFDPFVDAFHDAHFFQSAADVHPTAKPSFTFFSYDFRLSMAETAELLAKAIQEVQVRSGVVRINIVAHSMGAVTTLSTLARHPELESRVGNVVLIGPPINGAAETLTSLIAPREDWASKILASLVDVAKIAPTWPGGFYQLLPSPYYDKVARQPLVRLNREDGPRLALDAAYSFILGQVLNESLVRSTQDYTAATQQAFVKGPFGKAPAASRVHLLKGDAPTNGGIYLREINPINFGQFPYMWKLYSRVGRADGYGLSVDAGGNVGCSRSPALWWFWSSHTESDDNFVLHTVDQGIVVARDEDKLVVVSSRSSEPVLFWHVNERGELECDKGVLTVTDRTTSGYNIRLRPRGASASDATRFFINLLEQREAVARVDFKAGDGTVPDDSQSIDGLVPPLQCHVFHGIDHSGLIQAPQPLEKVKALLDAAPRKVEFIQLGPVGGIGRYQNGNARDYSVAGPAGVRIKKMVWRNSPSWLNGLKHVVFERGAGEPVDLHIGAGDGEERVLELGPAEYLVTCKGVTSNERVGAYDWQVVRRVVFGTSDGRTLTLGNSSESGGKPFDLSPPSGYHICGFHGRAGWVLDCLGVYCAPISGWAASQGACTVGPTGAWNDDTPFDLAACGPVVAVTIWANDRDIKGIGLTSRNAAGELVGQQTGSTEGVGYSLQLDSNSGEYITAVDGLYTWVGGWALYCMVNELIVRTSKGQELKVGKGKQLASNGSDPLPFSYVAPAGFQIQGFVGRMGGWGLMALGCHVVPLSTKAMHL